MIGGRVGGGVGWGAGRSKVGFSFGIVLVRCFLPGVATRARSGWRTSLLPPVETSALFDFGTITAGGSSRHGGGGGVRNAV